MKTEQLKIAKAISFIGHPLLTIPLFVTIMMFAFEDFEKALLNSTLIIGCIFLPLFLRIYVKSKNGTYTNFDVSDRIQRKTLYTFIIPLMIVVTGISFKTSPASNYSISVLFATILIIISQVINLFIKSSLHVSLNIYLSALILMVDLRIGLAVFSVLRINRLVENCIGTAYLERSGTRQLHRTYYKRYHALCRRISKRINKPVA